MSRRTSNCSPEVDEIPGARGSTFRNRSITDGLRTINGFNPVDPTVKMGSGQ